MMDLRLPRKRAWLGSCRHDAARTRKAASGDFIAIWPFTLTAVVRVKEDNKATNSEKRTETQIKDVLLQRLSYSDRLAGT